MDGEKITFFFDPWVKKVGCKKRTMFLPTHLYPPSLSHTHSNVCDCE